MIDLRQHRDPLRRFIDSGLSAFRLSHREEPIGHVALYCCPWRGWVSLCLAPVQQSDQNCPDVKHFQVAVYPVAQWADEYEQATALKIVDLAGRATVVDVTAEGDEALNRLFFEFLKIVLHEPSTEAAICRVSGRAVRIGVQCLDSAYNESWSPAA